MAHRLTVIFEKEAEGGFHIFCPTLPMKKALRTFVKPSSCMSRAWVEDGLPIPAEDIFIKAIEIAA